MRTALTILTLAAAGFALTADDATEEAPPATEEAAPEAPPVDCETLEDADAKAKCIEDAKKAAEPEEEEPKKAGKGRSSSGNMDMEGEADE